MQESNHIKDYLEKVCDQIRWKKAHGTVSKELGDHIEDQAAQYRRDGSSVSDAEVRALLEMGDPITTGGALDHVYRPKHNWMLLLTVGLFLLTGLALRIALATSNLFQFELLSTISGLLFGLAAFAAAYFIDVSAFLKHYKTAYLLMAAAFFLIMLLTPSYSGKNIYAQYILLLVPVAFTGAIYALRGKGIPGILLCGVFAAVPLLFGAWIPSMSGILLCGVSELILITLAIQQNWFDAPKRTAYTIVYFPFALVLLLGILKGWHRFRIMLHPNADPMGIGYLPSILREILQSSVLIGSSSENRILASQSLPDANSDYLLAFMISQFGWIVLIVLCGLMCAVILQGIQICRKQSSFAGRLTSTAILSVYTLQCLLYIASNLGVSLYAGFPFPFLSGNISTAVNLFLMGILLSVFRTSCLTRDAAETAKPSDYEVVNRLIEVGDGKIIVHLKR